MTTESDGLATKTRRTDQMRSEGERRCDGTGVKRRLGPKQAGSDHTYEVWMGGYQHWRNSNGSALARNTEQSTTPSPTKAATIAGCQAGHHWRRAGWLGETLTCQNTAVKWDGRWMALVDKGTDSLKCMTSVRSIRTIPSDSCWRWVRQ